MVHKNLIILNGFEPIWNGEPDSEG